MRNKLLSVMLVLAMTISLFAGITVNAASPIVFNGAETVLFDQSFGGLSSAADASDFTFSGAWQFTNYFAQIPSDPSSSYIQTKDSYNLTDASGWELETKIECTYNGYIITVPGGYTVAWNHNSDGAPIILKKDGTEVARSTGLIYLYDADATWKVKYLDGTWTITAEYREDKVTLTYADPSNPTFNGKFRISSNYTSKFTAYYMKLTQFAASSVAKHWNIEHSFSANDTVEKLAAKGITFSAAPTFKTDYAQTGSNFTMSIAPTGSVTGMFAGDYVLTTKFYKYQQLGYLRFNKNGSNYYDLYFKAGTADTQGTLSLRKNGTVIETKNFATMDNRFATYTATVKVYNGTDSTRIVADVYTTAGKETISFDYTDTTSPITSGTVELQGQHSNHFMIYNVGVYSPVSDEEIANEKPVMYTDVVVDKTITSADTVESLTAEGFTVPNKTINDTGIASEYSAVTYNAPLGDNYGFKARVYRNYNASEIRFDNANSNYYYVKAQYGSASNKFVIISRKDLGDDAPLAKFQTSTSTSDSYNYGYCNWSDYEVTVSTDPATGYKTIKLVFSPAAGNAVTLTAIDNNPIKDGINVNIYGNSSGKVKSFTLKKYGTSWAEEVINKTFTSADTADSLRAIGVTTSSGPAFTDDKGIYWSTKNNRYVYYTNDTAFKGSYSFTIKGGRTDSGDAKIQFAKSGSNYYEFVSPYNNYWTLNKVQNGTTYNLYTSSAKAGYTESGRNTNFEATVTVTEQADGSMKINILWSTAGVLRQNITYVDSLTDTSLVDGVATDNGAPITSGTACHVYQGWASARVTSFKLTKYNTSKWYDSNNKPLFVGRFFDGAGNGLSKPVNGIVYFDYPTSRLGTYKVIAALYENNEMTAITVLEPEAIYGTMAKLFTVNDAENAKIKVFFVDGEETLNNITEVYELN